MNELVLFNRDLATLSNYDFILYISNMASTPTMKSFKLLPLGPVLQLNKFLVLPSLSLPEAHFRIEIKSSNIVTKHESFFDKKTRNEMSLVSTYDFFILLLTVAFRYLSCYIIFF